MSSIIWRRGNELPAELQRQALAFFVHRYTGESTPQWVRRERRSGIYYPVHFRDDAEWLANTDFAVTKAGQLRKNVGYCLSKPTFPNGTEIKRKAGI